MTDPRSELERVIAEWRNKAANLNFGAYREDDLSDEDQGRWIGQADALKACADQLSAILQRSPQQEEEPVKKQPLEIAKEWCLSAAEREAIEGDPDCTTGRPGEILIPQPEIDNGNVFRFCDYVAPQRAMEPGRSKGCVRGAGHNGPHAFHVVSDAGVVLGPIILAHPQPETK